MRIYGEDEDGAWWVWRGHADDLLGRGREPMLGRAEDIVILRSGFALRVDDIWRMAINSAWDPTLA